jgi:hypothetical protein
VVLAVTGAEALYADMGHFGRPPIRRAWFLFVFPALTLNYLGQGSLILGSPEAIDNLFFLLLSIVEGNAKNRPDSRAVCSLSGHRLCLARAGLKVDGGGPHRVRIPSATSCNPMQMGILKEALLRVLGLAETRLAPDYGRMPGTA